MIFSLLVLLVLFLTCRSSAVIDEPKSTGRIFEAEENDRRKKIKAAGGCNANISFAIDASGSIGAKEFLNERNFILDAASAFAVDKPADHAACQYSTTLSAVQPLTPDIASFILAVQHTAQLKGQSFVVGGINYCFSQLWRRQREANHIVLLGDGKSNIGSSAVQRADLFRQRGGNVSVVTAVFADNKQLFSIAGGKHDHVFKITSFMDVLSLQAIFEKLAAQICPSSYELDRRERTSLLGL